MRIRTGRAAPRRAAGRSASARRISWKSARSAASGRGLATAVQDRGGVERRDHGPAAPREPLAADPADRDLLAEDVPGRPVPERDDDGGVDERDPLVEPGPARLELVGERVAVARRPAHHDVVDVDVLACDADLGEQLVQQLAGGADERLALLVLVEPGRLPDEHQIRVRIADAVHDLGPPLGETAPRAGRRVERRLLEGPHLASPSDPRPDRRNTAQRTRRADPATDRLGDRPRRHGLEVALGASTSPVASANTVSPSHIVCAGVTASDTPSLPACASSCARSLDSPAFVATTTSVVLVPGHVRGSASGLRFSAIGASVLVQHRPERVHGGERRDDQLALLDRRAAQPALPAGGGVRQLGERRAGPGADAPLLDGSVRRRLARGVARPPRRAGPTRRRPRGRTARRPARSAPAPPRRRTRSLAPRASAATPPAAASPNALPPVSSTAWTSFTAVPGRMASVSRVPGAPPLTSTDPFVPGGHSTTVHPVTPAAVGQVADPDPRDARDHPRTARSITRSSVSSGAAGAPRRRTTRAAG